MTLEQMNALKEYITAKIKDLLPDNDLQDAIRLHQAEDELHDAFNLPRRK